MNRILVTAFEPYGPFQSNASQLCLARLASQPWETSAVFRLYPVDFQRARQMLADDLAAHYTLAVHLGQSPYARAIQLEAVALNVGGPPDVPPEHYQPLEADGPVAYRTPLPLDRLASGLREQGIAAQVSYHAGTYLCNAVYYWSHYLAARLGLSTIPLFVHLPLVPEQLALPPFTPLPPAVSMPPAPMLPPAAMAADQSAHAVRTICRRLLEWMC